MYAETLKMMKNVRVGLEEAEESLKELNQQPLGDDMLPILLLQGFHVDAVRRSSTFFIHVRLL